MTLRLPYIISERFDSVGLQANFDKIARAFPVGPQDVVQRRPTTTAPASPVDGEDWFYLADDANGVVWHFKYRAGSGSDYKWEFVGGPPLSSAVVTTETTTSGTYAALTTAGPSVTVPLAGDYIVEIGCNAQNDTANVRAAHSYDIGATGAVDDDSASHTAGAANPSSVMSRRRHDGLAASTLIASKYKTGTATTTTATFRRRVMHVLPVRVKSS